MISFEVLLPVLFVVELVKQLTQTSQCKMNASLNLIRHSYFISNLCCLPRMTEKENLKFSAQNRIN